MQQHENIETPCSTLSYSEIDALKYAASQLSIKELEDVFDISNDITKNNRFFSFLDIKSKIQPFSKRVPKYGIAYRGRPHFITDIVLKQLISESKEFRQLAIPATKMQSAQLIYQPDSDSFANKLANSQDLLNIVNEYAGEAVRSYMTSYIYYDQKGQSSPPHVDNAFTAITVMLALEHECQNGVLNSSSVSYWPNQKRLDYQLRPSEISIFFGVSALHGRTPVGDNETVTSILLSFRPSELCDLKTPFKN